MAYSQDLVHRGGPPPSRHRRESQDSYGDYDDDRSGPRASEGRYHGTDEWYGQSRDPHSRSGNSRKILRIRFEDALADLFNLLTASLAFYSNFKSEFDNEVQGVVAYAGVDLLDELWVRKVKHSEDRRGGRDPRDREPPRDRSEAPQDFTGTYRLLREKFDLALRASQPQRAQRPGHDDGRHANYIRILQKLKAGHRDIAQLAAHARTRNAEMEPLMMELELLATYLEKNKGVWQDNDRGEDGRYLEQGGEGGPKGQEACK